MCKTEKGKKTWGFRHWTLLQLAFVWRRATSATGTFLLENRPALASRLERALFESGFEVLHLDGAAASPGALVQTIRAMLGIGAVSIYSGDVLDAETKEQLVADVKAKLFELSRENENANDEEVFRRALALAQTLRFAKLESNEEEAD